MQALHDTTIRDCRDFVGEARKTRVHKANFGEGSRILKNAAKTHRTRARSERIDGGRLHRVLNSLARGEHNDEIVRAIAYLLTHPRVPHHEVGAIAEHHHTVKDIGHELVRKARRIRATVGQPTATDEFMAQVILHLTGAKKESHAPPPKSTHTGHDRARLRIQRSSARRAHGCSVWRPHKGLGMH